MDIVRTTTNRERKTKSGQVATVSQGEAKLRRLFGSLNEHCTRQCGRETSNFMPSSGSVAQQSEKVLVYELQPQVKATTTAKKRKSQENESVQSQDETIASVSKLSQYYSVCVEPTHIMRDICFLSNQHICNSASRVIRSNYSFVFVWTHFSYDLNWGHLFF